MGTALAPPGAPVGADQPRYGAEDPLTSATQTRGALLDRRLVRQVRAARRFFVVATVVGVASTAAVVVQAVLLATVVADAVAHHRPLPSLAPLLVGLGAAFLARAVLAWVASVAAEHTAGAVAQELRRRLVHSATELGPSWLSGERTGELSLTATRGITSLETYFGRYLPQLVLAALAPMAILVWIGIEDWPSVCILLALLLALPVVMIAFGRKARAQTTRQWRTLGSLAARFLEIIEGLPTLRAFGQEERGREEIATATERLRATTLATLRVAFLSGLAMDLLAGLGTGLVAMELGLRLLGGGVPLGTALAVLLVSPEVFLPVRRSAAEFHASAEGQAAAARVLDVVDRPTPPAESVDAGTVTRAADQRAPGRPAGAAVEPTAWDPAGATIELRDVTVTYAKRPGPVIDHLDLEIAPGARVALIGPSGSGKSTVLHLLLRFVALEHGDVVAGGIPFSDIDPALWRRRVSWVPQHPHLFRATLEQNLRMDLTAPGTVELPEPGDGHGDGDSATGGIAAPDLAEVLELTGLDAVAAHLPDGARTLLGPGAMQLSAGERQLVAVGRALLRSTPLVLLDEPTAHLDPDTASRVLAVLERWGTGRTLVIAAHDPDAVSGATSTCTLGEHLAVHQRDDRLAPIGGRPAQ